MTVIFRVVHWWIVCEVGFCFYWVYRVDCSERYITVRNPKGLPYTSGRQDRWNNLNKQIQKMTLEDVPEMNMSRYVTKLQKN